MSAKSEITCKVYENPDFAAIVRETTTYTRPDGTRTSSRRIIPAPDAADAEFCKAFVLAEARYGALMDLPYVIQWPEDEAAAAWREALTEDNPPGKVSFRRGKEGYPRFRDLVMPLDFRRFDPSKAAEIRAMYTSGSQVRKEFDAEEIALAELDGEAPV